MPACRCPMFAALALLLLAPAGGAAQDEAVQDGAAQDGAAQDGAAQDGAESAAQGTAGFAPLPAGALTLESFRWRARPLVVFADTPQDPAFAEQMRGLAARWPELAARDVAVIVDTDPAAASALRRALRPRGFALVIVEKDGTVALRKPFPWDGREIMRAIDRMPIRREEMRRP